MADWLSPDRLLLPAFTQFVWYLPGGVAPGFNEFVPFFHSLQYLYVAWALQLRERRDVLPDAPAVPFVARESIHWGLVNFWGGVAWWQTARLFARPRPALSLAGMVGAAVLAAATKRLGMPLLLAVSGSAGLWLSALRRTTVLRVALAGIAIGQAYLVTLDCEHTPRSDGLRANIVLN